MKSVFRTVFLAGLSLLALAVVLTVLTYGFLNGSGPMAILLAIVMNLAVPLTVVGGALLGAAHLNESVERKRAAREGDSGHVTG